MAFSLSNGVQVMVFGILAGMAVLFALGVVFAESIIYAGFLLAGLFLSMSGLYLLLNADFVAAAQVLIYVGAVNILILFAIMLVNRRYTFTPLKFGWLRNGVTGLVCVGLLSLLVLTVFQTPWPITAIESINAIETIGGHFFSDYLLPFELASVLLLMALIGAIILARREYILATQEKEGLFSLLERPRPQLEPNEPTLKR